MLRDSWRLAVGTLTAVPVAPPTVVDRRRAGMAMRLAPLAATPLGAAVMLVCMAGQWLRLSTLVTALLAIGAAVLGNRGLHLDGLSDVADGLAASYDRERSLEVMKSGSCGPAGVVATVLVVGTQVAGLAALLSAHSWWRASVLAGVAVCLSRVALTTCCVDGLRPARPDGLGAAYTQTIGRATAAWWWTLAAGVLGVTGHWAGLDWWRGGLAAALAAAVVVVLLARCVHRFGGVTGDVFGACIELTLATVLVVL